MDIIQATSLGSFLLCHLVLDLDVAGENKSFS